MQAKINRYAPIDVRYLQGEQSLMVQDVDLHIETLPLCFLELRFQMRQVFRRSTGIRHHVEVTFARFRHDQIIENTALLVGVQR